MASKKPSSKGKPKQEPARQPTRLENLAAKRPSFDDLTLDDQLVDNSGVFRVTSAIAQAQTGHDEGTSPRFANESLVMAAQRDGFPEEPTIDEAVEEHSIQDETTRADRKARLATLAQRAQQTKRR